MADDKRLEPTEEERQRLKEKMDECFNGLHRYKAIVPHMTITQVTTLVKTQLGFLEHDPESRRLLVKELEHIVQHENTLRAVQEMKGAIPKETHRTGPPLIPTEAWTGEPVVFECKKHINLGAPLDLSPFKEEPANLLKIGRLTFKTDNKGHIYTTDGRQLTNEEIRNMVRGADIPIIPVQDEVDAAELFSSVTGVPKAVFSGKPPEETLSGVFEEHQRAKLERLGEAYGEVVAKKTEEFLEAAKPRPGENGGTLAAHRLEAEWHKKHPPEVVWEKDVKPVAVDESHFFVPRELKVLRTEGMPAFDPEQWARCQADKHEFNTNHICVKCGGTERHAYIEAMKVKIGFVQPAKTPIPQIAAMMTNPDGQANPDEMTVNIEHRYCPKCLQNVVPTKENKCPQCQQELR